MKRHKWLIAAFTALFVLQAPLCVLACLPSADAATAVDAAHQSNSPCHESTPASSPAEPSSSHDDCGCEDSYTAVLASADLATPNLVPTAVIPPLNSADQLRVNLVWLARSNPNETDLPPPDVLLLKSTLII